MKIKTFTLIFCLLCSGVLLVGITSLYANEIHSIDHIIKHKKKWYKADGNCSYSLQQQDYDSLKANSNNVIILPDVVEKKIKNKKTLQEITKSLAYAKDTKHIVLDEKIEVKKLNQIDKKSFFILKNSKRIKKDYNNNAKVINDDFSILYK